MRFRITPEKVVRIATIATLAFMICWGLVQVVAEVRPFWIDEWRIIYNLKFKTATALWGPLDFMQQFPRVYMSVIKAFTSAFHYSYSALRVLPYIAGVLTIFLSCHLMKKLYAPGNFNRFLFVMMLVSCSTFTEYFVEIKQYTMDLLLGLVALWQLMCLLEIDEQTRPAKRPYLLLCASFLFVPFFSYTYPVAIAPVYFITLVQSILPRKNGTGQQGKSKPMLLKWLPLVIGAFSISVFYVVDVRQLMHDQGMHRWWGHLMMANGFNWNAFFINFWDFFAQIGAGLVFWIIFGILGIASFLSAIRLSAVAFYQKQSDKASLARLYSVALLILMIVLSVAGKFPLGEPRLNAFSIPATAIIIIHFLDAGILNKRWHKATMALSILLYAGLTGNIYSTFYASITGPVYAKQMTIYRSTETAIVLAQNKHLPILITPEVAFPYDTTQNVPFYESVPGDWVLKTFPAYNPSLQLPVYGIGGLNTARQKLNSLPPNIASVLAGNGLSYSVLNR